MYDVTGNTKSLANPDTNKTLQRFLKTAPGKLPQVACVKPMGLAYGKVETRRVTLVGQHGATRSSRQARQARLARHVFRGVTGRLHRVDWGGHVHLTFSIPKIDANPSEHERLNLCTRALLLRRPPYWNKHDTTRSTHRTYRIVSRRDVVSQVEFGLKG